MGLHLPPEEQHLSQRGGADASADGMKLEMEKEEKRQSIWTHDRSHLSRWWLPLSAAPPARQAQLHVAPARSTAQHCLLACLPVLAITALSLHLPSASLPVYQSLPPFRLCRCLDGKLWVTTSSGCAGQRQAAIGCKCRGKGNIVVKRIGNARPRICEKRGENDEYYKRIRTTSHFIPPSAIPAASHKAQAQTVAT